MRLALADISWHLPGPKNPEVFEHARQVVIDEINNRGGNWADILDEVLGLLDNALMDMFSTPDPDCPNHHAVDVVAITEWLADQIEDELDRIEHDR